MGGGALKGLYKLDRKSAILTSESLYLFHPHTLPHPNPFWGDILILDGSHWLLR